MFTGAHHDLAVDVARLEWAYIEAFDSATMPPLDETDLAALQPTTVLALQPHLQLLALRYPADKVVLAAHKNQPDADIVSNAVMGRKTSKRVRLPRLRRSPTYLVVHRHKDSVYYRRIDREELLLLSAIQEGEPLRPSWIKLSVKAACYQVCGRRKSINTLCTQQSWDG